MTMPTTEHRTYQGSTLAEALGALKADLGPDAEIVEQRKVRAAGMGPLGRALYEVVGRAGDVAQTVRAGRLAAAAALSAYARRPEIARAASAPAAGRPADPAGIADVRAVGRAVPRPRRAETETPDALRREIAALRREFAALAEDVRARWRTDFPGLLAERYADLLGRGVADATAREIVHAVAKRTAADEFEDAAVLEARVRHEVAGLLHPAGGVAVGDDGPTVLVAVGPTGVGKTTTLAKIGATLSLEERRSVAFVTLDNYRIAAAEQLRRYAEILSAPFEEAADAADLRRALEYHGERDVILVDTAGLAPRDGRANDLSALLDGLPHRVEVHLLVSATTKDEDLRLAVRGFRRGDETRLVFTKVDEAERTGNLLNIAAEARLPISYVTTGQNVPDDIEIADRDRLLDRILGASGGGS